MFRFRCREAAASGQSLSFSDEFYFVGVPDVAFRMLNRVCVLLGALTFMAGCGRVSDAPSTVPVKGVIKYQGKPVPKLSVAFIPDKGMLASGTTDAEGRYSLMTNKPGDGAMVGTYKVAISYISDVIPEMPGLPGTEKPPAPSPIPLKYADPKTSGLTSTIGKDAGKIDFDFNLTD